MFSESNFRNLRQDFLIGSDLERCQSLNQSAETRRLSHLGSGQCPWELHWDKERNRFAKKSGVLGRQNIVDIFFICTQGCGWTPLVRHLLKPFLELMLEFVKKKKKRWHSSSSPTLFCDSFQIKASHLKIAGQKNDELWGQGTG